MFYAAIAQLVERVTCNDDVRSSILRGGTNLFLDSSVVEPRTVNALVVGSNPSLGANFVTPYGTELYRK